MYKLPQVQQREDERVDDSENTHYDRNIKIKIKNIEKIIIEQEEILKRIRKSGCLRSIMRLKYERKDMITVTCNIKEISFKNVYIGITTNMLNDEKKFTSESSHVKKLFNCF